MSSILPAAYETLQIPEALTLEHDEILGELNKVAAVRGDIGTAARRVARLCALHFAKEEDTIIRTFGLLHDLASDRVRPDGAAIPVIAQFKARHYALRRAHSAIDVAVMDLFQAGKKADDTNITGLVRRFRDHERNEDEAIYPTVLRIARAVQSGTKR